MSNLTEVELQALREHVLREVARTSRRAADLQRDFTNIVEVSADAVRDDEHDPEGATIAFERAQIAALLSDARSHLAALASAQARLEDGRLGTCERCGRAIGFERLLARPAATRCVDCAGRG